MQSVLSLFIDRVTSGPVVANLVGLGFAGVAAYGMVTGRYSAEAPLAVASAYLGVKIQQAVTTTKA